MDTENNQLIEIGYGTAHGTALIAGSQAAQKAMTAIERFKISAVLVFAAATYDLDAVLEGIHQVVGDVPVFGAMDAGEICDTIQHGTVTVAILASPYLRVHTGVGTNVSADWRRALDEALDTPAVRPFFNDPEHIEKLRRQGRDYFVMLFTPGITGDTQYRGFEIIEALKERTAGDCPLIGGGATDERLIGNSVLLDQQAYTDSVLIVVFETELQFGISLTHGFRPTEQRAIITAVDGAEVLAIDGQPAAEAYTQLVGVPKDRIGIHPTYIEGDTVGMSEPMGQYTVNVVDAITPGGGIRLCKPMPAGTVLTRMQSSPSSLVQAGPEAIRKAAIRGGMKDIALCLLCYCALRPTLLGDLTAREFAAMREVIGGKPLVGFLCCGEVGLEADGVSRLNRSSVACLVLGSQLSPLARITHENNQLLSELTLQSAILSRTNEDLWNEISQRKKAEEALRESDERYRQLFYLSPAAKVLVDPENGAIVDINKAATEFYGYTAAEARRLTIYDISLSHQEAIRQHMLSSPEDGSIFTATKHRLCNGEIRDVEVYSQIIYIAGQKHYYFIVMDITARKQAEEELAQNRDRLAAVVEISKAGICEWDIPTGKIFYDQRWKEIIGYQEDELADTYEEWRKLLHPEDIKAITKAERSCLAGKTDKFVFDCRLRHKNGTYRWVHAGGKLIFNQVGRPIRATGYAIDITDNKKAEELREASEKRLRDFAQAIPATACIVDEDGRYIEVISGNDTVLGKTRKELIGFTLHEVWPAEIADQMIAGIRLTIPSGLPRQRIYEAEIRGQKWVVDARAASMEYVVNGKKTVATVVLDITEQREIQKRLQFAYDLRRTSSFLNDIIAGAVKADTRDLATTLRFELDLGRPLVCCLVILQKLGATATYGDHRSLDIHMVKNDIIYAIGDDPRYLVWACREGIGVLWQVADPDHQRQQSNELTATLTEKIAHSAPGFKVLIGVGNANTGDDSILIGYRQAWSACLAARAKDEASGAVEYFNDIGIYQLLANIGGQNQANEFVRQKLGPLIDYDSQKGTDYLHTLEEILRCANLKEAADKLFIHHKTVIFRKQRIEKMLGVAVDHFEEKLALAAAIKLSKIGKALGE